MKDVDFLAAAQNLCNQIDDARSMQIETWHEVFDQLMVGSEYVPDVQYGSIHRTNRRLSVDDIGVSRDELPAATVIRSVKSSLDGYHRAVLDSLRSVLQLDTDVVTTVSDLDISGLPF